MDNKNTQTGSGGSAADAGAAIATISTQNPESEARLRALVAERGAALRIRLDAPADLDVSGHELDATSLTLHVVDDDNDTEGHAISLHFPNVQEAKHFEQRMIATGAIVGTLVIAGSGLALSQALPDASTTMPTQAQVESTTNVTYGANVASSSGTGLTGKEQALMGQIAAGASLSTGSTLTGKEQALMEQLADPNAVVTSSGQAAADQTSGAGAAASTGKAERLMGQIAADDEAE